VYKAVANASGSYVVSELWKNREDRKSSIAEAIHQCRKQWKDMNH